MHRRVALFLSSGVAVLVAIVLVRSSLAEQTATPLRSAYRGGTALPTLTITPTLTIALTATLTPPITPTATLPVPSTEAPTVTATCWPPAGARFWKM